MSLPARLGWYGTQYTIGIQLLPAEPHIQVLHIRQRKGRLEPVKWLACSDETELMTHLSRWPLAGLHLHVPHPDALEGNLPSGQQNPLEALLGADPSAAKAFVYQRFPAKESDQVTVVRREALLDAWERLGEESSRVMSVSLSQAGIAYLLPASSTYDDLYTYEIQMGEHTPYYWQGGLISKATGKTSTPVSPQDISREVGVPPSHLGLFGAMVQQALGATDTLSGWDSLPGQQNRVQNQLRAAKGLIITALVCLVGVGGLGAMLGWSQYKETQSLALIQENRAWLQKLDSNQVQIDQLTQQKEFIEVSGQNITYLTVALDRIARLVPNGVMLDAWQIPPDEEQIERIQRLTQNEQVPDMAMEGWADETEELGVFLRKLHEQSFLDQASIIQTKYNRQRQQHAFLLILTLNSHELETQ